MMTRLLTVTPVASRCLCVAESLSEEVTAATHAVPHLNPRYLSLISALTGTQVPYLP